MVAGRFVVNWIQIQSVKGTEKLDYFVSCDLSNNQCARDSKRVASWWKDLYIVHSASSSGSYPCTTWILNICVCVCVCVVYPSSPVMTHPASHALHAIVQLK